MERVCAGFSPLSFKFVPTTLHAAVQENTKGKFDLSPTVHIYILLPRRQASFFFSFFLLLFPGTSQELTTFWIVGLSYKPVFFTRSTLPLPYLLLFFTCIAMQQNSTKWKHHLLSLLYCTILYYCTTNNIYCTCTVCVIYILAQYPPHGRELSDIFFFLFKLLKDR